MEFPVYKYSCILGNPRAIHLGSA